MNNKEILFALLRSEITGAELTEQRLCEIRERGIGGALALANIHDLVHILADATEHYSLKTDVAEREALASAQEMAFYRYKRLENATRIISDALSEAKVPHILLKGARMRRLYEHPWWRTSADVDVLVKEEDLERAKDALVGRCAYRVKGRRAFHDVSLFSPEGVHLELHFSIKENSEIIDSVLGEVWANATSSDGGYEYELSPHFFLFHLLTHLAYHFINGGCGIKPFMDLWIYEKKIEVDTDAFSQLLKRAQLADFYENAVRLSQVWFGGAEHTELTLEMEAHVVENSICGKTEKGIVLQQSKYGGRAGYIFRRIFPPYKQMKIRYPVLKKHAYLLPVFTIVRWMTFIFGNKKRARAELSSTARVTETQMKELVRFLKKTGLKKHID